MHSDPLIMVFLVALSNAPGDYALSDPELARPKLSGHGLRVC
jgi:hypothetical protein